MKRERSTVMDESFLDEIIVMEDPVDKPENYEENPMEHMTEDEALAYLGIERTELFPGLEEMRKKKSRLWNRILEFLFENYPEQLPLMFAQQRLEAFVDEREEEASELFATIHQEMRRKEIEPDMDTLERIRKENELYQRAWEIVDSRVTYRPLSFT
jgi:hypothetical protein